MPLYDKVVEIIVEQLGVRPDLITPDASFIEDLGADSLDTVELIMAFEEEFGIEIPDEEAVKVSTVGTAVAMLAAATGDDARLPSSYQNVPTTPEPPPPPRRVAFEVADGDGATPCPVVVHSVPIRMPDFQSICDEVEISPSGQGFYLSVYREKKASIANLYDLKYCDFATGEMTNLVDIGTDGSYYSAILGGSYYRTQSIKDYTTHRIHCFHGAQSISPPKGWPIVEDIRSVNGKLAARVDEDLLFLDNQGVLGRIPVERDLFSVVWGHPLRNIILLDYRKYDASKGEIDSDVPARYVVVEFDDSFAVTRREEVCLTTQKGGCGWFTYGHMNDVIFAEYMSKAAVIKSLDIDTLEITTLVEGVTSARSLHSHPLGLVFFGDEVEEDQSMTLRVFDRNAGNAHVLGSLTDGAFWDFSLSDDWRRLVFRNVLDTTGDGNYYSSEDESEIYTMELKFAASTPETLIQRWQTDGGLARLFDVAEAINAERSLADVLAGFSFVSEVADGRDLRGIPLSGAELSNIDISGVTLTGADLSGALVRKANMQNVDLQGANLAECDMTTSNLTGATLTDADLSEAKFSACHLGNASLKGVNAPKVDMRGADLSGADLSGASFEGGNLRLSNLSETDLSGTNLQAADLMDVDLSGRELMGVNLQGAVLRRANLSGSNLSNVNLQGADLTETDLAGAILQGADLSQATIANASLEGSDLTGAHFKETNIRDAKFSGADLRGADLRGFNLTSVDLSNADLIGADLTDATLGNTNLSHADLRTACLVGADLSTAHLDGANLNHASYSESQRKKGIFGFKRAQKPTIWPDGFDPQKAGADRN